MFKDTHTLHTLQGIYFDSKQTWGAQRCTRYCDMGLSGFTG